GAKNAMLAWIRNGDDVQLQRADLQSLGWRRRVSDTVVDYCCAMAQNASSNARFCTDFYCILSRLMALILTDDNIERCAGTNTGFVLVLSSFIGHGQHRFDTGKAKQVKY
ncbi:hypothetical protein S245_059077, partial [Arachis hypogaea]